MIDATQEEEITPNRLSFSHYARHVLVFLTTIPIRSAGKLPIHFEDLLETLRLFNLNSGYLYFRIDDRIENIPKR